MCVSISLYNAGRPSRRNRVGIVSASCISAAGAGPGDKFADATPPPQHRPLAGRGNPAGEVHGHRATGRGHAGAALRQRP